MTNTIHSTTFLLAAAACATTELPERTYDFAERAVTGKASLPTTTSSPRAQLRSAIDQLQPALARCTAGTSGRIDLTLRIAMDSEPPVLLASAQVAYPDPIAALCVRGALGSLDLSRLTCHEPAIWIVHMPLVVDARS
jgi:hypothetical protein